MKRAHDSPHGRAPSIRPTIEARQTDCEWLIWQKLRARQLLDLKFRRQHPCPPYVIDFYCVELQLAIELDGSQHFTAEQQVYDRRRSLYLAGLGVVVLRFDNRQVLQEMDGVLQAIWVKAQLLLKSPSPQPSPGGRGGLFVVIADSRAVSLHSLRERTLSGFRT